MCKKVDLDAVGGEEKKVHFFNDDEGEADEQKSGNFCDDGHKKVIMKQLSGGTVSDRPRFLWRGSTIVLKVFLY